MEKREGQMLIRSAPAWSRGAPRINREGERVNAVAVTRAGAPVSFFYTEGGATQIWERERETRTRWFTSVSIRCQARLIYEPASFFCASVLDVGWCPFIHGRLRVKGIAGFGNLESMIDRQPEAKANLGWPNLSNSTEF
jgi:hypothetical protein